MSIELPFFSIIIPTYGRKNQLAICLEAVVQLDYPQNCFEVILVDDGSPLPVADVVDIVRPKLDISLIRQDNAGPASARNSGADRAKGRFLAFTDDDCAPYPDWLLAFANILKKHPDCLVGGHTYNALPDNLYAVASQMLSNYLYEYNLEMSDHPQKFFASNNIAISSELFLEFGGFDVTFPLAAGEDRDFCNRWLQEGRKMRYIPNARIKHYQELNAHSFLRQHFGYGRGNYHYHKRRTARGGSVNRLEPWSFYSGLMATPWKTRSGITAGVLTILLLLSQAANAIGYLWARLVEPVRRIT